MSQRTRPRAGKGDFTGREKERINADRLAARRDESARMAMAEADEAQEDMYGVFDKEGNQIDVLPGGPEEAFVIDDEESTEDGVAPPPPQFGQNQSLLGSEPILTGKETEEELARLQTYEPPKPVHRPGTQVAHPAMVVVRVNEDIEKMTYGMIDGVPNNYNFREGRATEVPYEVAEHLDSLGLIRQWVK